MRRTIRSNSLLRLVAGLAALVCVCAGELAIGQDPPPEQERSTASPPPEPRETPAVTTEAPPKTVRPADRGDTLGLRFVAKFEKLHSAMQDKLGLDSDQERAITELFDDHYRRLRGAPDDIKYLRRKYFQARGQGDREAMNKYRKQLLAMRRQQRGPVAVGTEQLIADVKAQLDEGQQSRFLVLVKETLVSHQQAGASGRLVALWRALARPAVGLTEEQRRRIQQIRVRSKELTTTARATRDEAKVHAVVKKIHGYVLETLTKEQQAKVRATLGLAKPPAPTGPKDEQEPKIDPQQPIQAKPPEAKPQSKGDSDDKRPD